MDKDDLWVVDHFSELVTKYAGKFVAVVNETLVAVGDTRRDVETKAREVEPNKIPSVLRVPREEDMVRLLSSFHTRSMRHLLPIIPIARFASTTTPAR